MLAVMRHMRSPRTSSATVRRLACAALGALGMTLLAAPAHARSGRRGYRFDGFKIGDSYSGLFARAPYNKPCDDDPVDQKRRRAMVYGALPCRGLTFPDATTVVVFLRMNAPGSPWASEPVVALAWLHGSYFKTRSNFPVQPGDRLDKARRLLGRPLGQMALRTKRMPPMTAWRFAGDVHVLTEGDHVRGAVVGPMPTDPENEQWRVILQMARRYTPPSGLPPQTPKGLTRDCAALWKRAVACQTKSRMARKIVSDADRYKEKCEHKMQSPKKRAVLMCAARAATCEAFDRCGRGPEPDGAPTAR